MIEKDLLQKGLEEQQKEELTYADDWVDESIFWAQNQVYQRAAANLPPLQRGDVHIDMGSGVGLLPMFISAMQPEATVLGIERNPHMLRHLLSLHSELEAAMGTPIPLEVYHGEIMGLGQAGVKSFYLPLEEIRNLARNKQSDWIPREVVNHLLVRTGRLEHLGMYPTPDPELSQAGVKIIVDDILDLKLTRYYLGDRRVQSFSSTFPGTSGRILKERGVKKGDYQVARMLAAAAGKEKIEKEMEFIVANLAPRGTFMVMSRVPADATKTETGRREVAQSLQSYISGYLDVFESDFSAMVSDRSYRNPTAPRIVWHSPNGQDFIQEARVVTAYFRRKA